MRDIFEFNLSPPQRPPTAAPWEKYTRGARRLGRGKIKARGERWEGERKKGGLCQILCGSLAGFAVLWFWLNQTTIWTVLNVLSKI